MDYFRAFKTPSRFARELLFYTDGLGHHKSKDFLIDRECFNNNLIMYVLSGKLHVEQKGHHIIGKNEGIIMRLTEKHKYYTDETDTCEILWMHFSGRQSEIFMQFLEQTCEMPLIFIESKVEKLVRHCFKLFRDNSNDREFLVSRTIYSTILTIIDSVCRDKRIDLNTGTEFMSRAIDYIENNVYKKFTLEDIAKEFNISRYYFCKVFKKHFHMTPMKYVLKKKIEISKYLLSYTHESISCIAASLNFVDQSHFSRTFKDFEKQSPLSFRNNIHS